MRAQQGSYLPEPLISNENSKASTQLPPGGGLLDITPASATIVPPTDASLESIAKRMLSRTTVGHRKRRARQSASTTAAGLVKASELPVSDVEEPEKRRVPPPSQIPVEEIPSGMTISSIDCEAWYNDQWDDYYDEEFDPMTQAYLSMQREIQKGIAEEKQKEEDFTMTEQEAGMEEASPLRDALPMSFGRPSAVAPPSKGEEKEHVTEKIAPVTSGNLSSSIVNRFKAIRSTIYGS